jgi:uncharacterized protein with HEPN domain
MLRKEDADRLYHMVEAAREALDYAQGHVRQDLETDRPLMHSLVRCLEIIGEAANKITPELREARPEIPWGNMIATRNRVVHAYFAVNLSIIWRTVTEELPLLIAQIEPLLSDKDST